MTASAMTQPSTRQLDEQLQQLAVEAQQQPFCTKERQQALTKLFDVVLRSRCLCQPQRGYFPAEVYRDIYNEALQKLLLYACQNIDRYDPQRGAFLKWLNFLLDKRFIDVINERQNRRTTYIPDITALDHLRGVETASSTAQAVRQCIEEDPENLFKQIHIQNHPAATFQALAICYMDGRTWQEISAEFSVKIPTLSSFYQRCLERFTPKLKEYLQN